MAWAVRGIARVALKGKILIGNIREETENQ
jgi:hypothetical protein